MNTETKTIADYITERGVTAKTQHVGRAIGDNWTKDHHEYIVTLTLPSGASIRTSYKCNPLFHVDTNAIHKIVTMRSRFTDFKVSLGGLDNGLRYVGTGRGGRSVDQAEYDKMAEERVPAEFQANAADVLDCLLSDASNTDAPFEEWAADYGYDTDSRKAEAIFHACRETAAKLRSWLGAVELERLASEYERL